MSQSDHSLSNLPSLSSQSAPQSPLTANPPASVTGDNTSASSEPVTSSSDPVASSSTSTPNDCHLAVTFGSSSSVSSSTVGSAFKEAAAGHAKHATQVGPQGTQGKAVLRQHGGGGGGGGGPPGYNKQPGSFFHKSAEEPPKDPSACEVQPGKETVIEINKDKLGLGLSIVGGSDTLLVTLATCFISIINMIKFEMINLKLIILLLYRAQFSSTKCIPMALLPKTRDWNPETRSSTSTARVSAVSLTVEPWPF